MSGAGGVLALDLASHTGWAYGVSGVRPLSGVWHLPSITSGGATGAALIDRLTDVIQGMRPALIVCEAPLPPQAQTAMSTARLQFGLAFAVELVGHWFDVTVREEKADVVRMAMLGRSRFPKGTTKDAVMAWCREQGWQPPEHNAADACLLWAHACTLIAKKNGGPK